MRLAAAMHFQAQARREAGLPTLPLEVLEQVIGYLSLPASEGEIGAVRALLRLSVVSRLLRVWALDALYEILVLPRHVRDFRKWYQRMRTCSPPFPCAGHVRGVFFGIDDVRAPLTPDHASHGCIGRLGVGNATLAALLWSYN